MTGLAHNSFNMGTNGSRDYNAKELRSLKLGVFSKMLNNSGCRGRGDPQRTDDVAKSKGRTNLQQTPQLLDSN